jgi:hypothetical protein
MGDCYTHQEQYKDAVHTYNRALVADPECAAAIAALDRLDKLMRGLDPNDNSDEIAVEEETESSSPVVAAAAAASASY